MRCVKFAWVTLAVLAPLCAQLAHAGPHDSVESPVIVEGEKEVELKWGFQRNRDGSSEGATPLGVGVGVTPWYCACNWSTSSDRNQLKVPTESRSHH